MSLLEEGKDTSHRLWAHPAIRELEMVLSHPYHAKGLLPLLVRGLKCIL